MLINTIGGLWTGFGSAGPRSFYINGEGGAFFDFSAPAALFQDAAGATALTTPGQTIGLAGDKSRTRAPVTSFAGIQASAGLRPTYGRAPKSRRNLLTYSEEFDNAAWLKGVSGTATAPVVTPNAALAPNGEMTADLVQLRLNGAVDGSFSWLYQNNSVQSGATRATSFYVKAANPADVGKVIRLLGTTNNAVSLTADLQRISNSALVAVGTVISVGLRLRGSDGTSDSVDLYLWGSQFEDGAIGTPYQKARSAFDMTEAGYPAYGYARLDGADDKLTVTLPAPITGDLMIFGRNGSWIEAGVTLPSGAFDLGPTGTVLTLGVLRALGDLVGVVIIGRTTTATERALALRYFAARGAANWLVAGAELGSNGGFATDTGWTKGAGWTIAAGVATHAPGAGSDIEQAGLLVAGQLYLLTVTAVAVRTTSILYVHDGGAYLEVGGTPSLTARIYQAVFRATASRALSIRVGSLGDVDIDNVSHKLLTVGT